MPAFDCRRFWDAEVPGSKIVGRTYCVEFKSAGPQINFRKNDCFLVEDAFFQQIESVNLAFERGIKKDCARCDEFRKRQQPVSDTFIFCIPDVAYEGVAAG